MSVVYPNSNQTPWSTLTLSSPRAWSPVSSETINRGQIQISLASSSTSVTMGEQQTTAQRREQEKVSSLHRVSQQCHLQLSLFLRLLSFETSLEDEINLHVQRFKECRAEMAIQIRLSRLCDGDTCLRDRVTIRCRQQRRQAPSFPGWARRKTRRRRKKRWSFCFLEVMRSLSLICAHSGALPRLRNGRNFALNRGQPRCTVPSLACLGLKPQNANRAS